MKHLSRLLLKAFKRIAFLVAQKFINKLRFNENTIEIAIEINIYRSYFVV